MANSRKRSARKGQKRQLNILQSLFFIVVLVLAGYILLQSSIFSIRQIQVEGVRQLTVAEVQRLSGIPLGINTFKLNLNDVENRVALNPLVKQVAVRRSYPAKIVIKLVERQAVALVPWQGEFLALDNEGYYISRNKDLSKVNLPIITGIRLGTLTPGKQIIQEGLLASLAFIRKMDQEQLVKVSEVNGADPQSIVLYTIEGIEVRLVAGERIEEKLALLKEALKNSYERRIEYVNICYEGKPVIKFAGDQDVAPIEQNNAQGKD